MTPAESELLEHIVDHLCEEQPEAVADLTDKEIERRAGVGIARARAAGFTQPEEITAFVTLMFVVAPDFDAHPKIAAALKVLSGPKRLQNLFAQTSEEDWAEAAEQSAGWERVH
jgi:hypothetical protein